MKKAQQQQSQSAPIPLLVSDAVVSAAGGDSHPLPAPPPIRKPGPDAASEKDLAGWAQMALALVTMMVASWLARGNENDPIFDAATMTDDELAALAAPLARIIARSDLNKQYGQRLIQSNDYLMLGAALWSYGQRVVPLIGQRVSSGKRASNVQAIRPVKSAGKPASSGNGNGGQPATAGNDAYHPAGLVASLPWNAPV